MSPQADRIAGLSIDQKRALLERLRRDRRAESRDDTLTGLFEAQLARSPDSIAVVAGGESLTYRALSERADRIAARLSSLGIEPETLVGVCLERTADMPAALLGILRVGGAYVPIDPAYPPARIALMLDDSRAPIVVTQRGLKESLNLSGTTPVLVDELQETTAAPRVRRATVTPENLAYVIYTSGSTGRPKGVQVTHGGVRAFLSAMRSLLEPGSTDTLLAVTTLSFDIAVLELFLPLISGGRVEIAPRDVATDGARLTQRLARGDVTMLQGTPATWRLLLEAGWSGNPDLTMLCGGEALTRPLADRLLPLGKALWNLYGPTETTVWSSACRVEPGTGPISIGKPIAGTQLYVLDALMRPVPVGIAGDLWIGGAGVARGYLDRPGLTAERFVPDPLSPTPGGRLYRTGDLARRRADGSFECLGRVDHQVKIRGFRIELGEVESALAAYSGVRVAAATARVDSAGEQALYGYVCPSIDTKIDLSDLRAFLADRLPEYMIPSRLLVLDSLPLTPNGKLDRGALPTPEAEVHAGARYVPPQGPLEDALAELWAELLERERPGAEDDFFELGGHSLFATRLFARVREVFGVEPSLREFLDRPTISGLAHLIEWKLAEGAVTAVPPIRPIPRGELLSTSFAQQRLWFLDRLEPGKATYNIPAAVRISGPLDIDALRSALDEIVRRHEILRTVYVDRGGVPMQRILGPASVPMQHDDLSALPSTERDAQAQRILAVEASQPFDLAGGPILRTRLLRLGREDHIVSIVIHHIATDGWSIGVFIREIGQLYETFRAGRPSPLPDPRIQYADFAAWQRECLRGELLESRLSYWSGRLQRIQPVELPADRPRTAVSSGRGDQRSITVAKATLGELRSVSRRSKVTLFMTLLAAYEVLLHRYIGIAEFAVGTPVAGRVRSDLEGLIGLFVNTLAIPADLSGDPTFVELLARTKAEALGAFSHQAMPFDQLVTALRSNPERGQAPTLQTMFVLQNVPIPVPAGDGLELEPIDLQTGTAKFELTFFASERPSGLEVVAEYDADLFKPETVDRMLRHYRTLLESIVEDPHRSIADFPMMTDEESRSLLSDYELDTCDALVDEPAVPRRERADRLPSAEGSADV